MEKKQRVKKSIMLDKKLVRQIKVRAALADKKEYQIVEEAIKKYFGEKEEK